MSSIETIRRLVPVMVPAGEEDGGPRSAPEGFAPAAGGRDEVVEAGGTRWAGEMAAPSFMILGVPPRR